MAAFVRQKPAKWFWIVAILIILWNIAGVASFYFDATMSEATLATLSEYDRSLYAARPEWVSWVYAIATWSGLLGGIALLMKRKLAATFFIVSLVAVILQFGWAFLGTDLFQVKGIVAAIFPVILVGICIFEIWLARYAERHGWIH